MLHIIVDNRERGLKELFETQFNQQSLPSDYRISYENLALGDIHIIYEHDADRVLMVFERKTLSDLLQSIHDTRYHSQKKRLLETYAPHQIAYIIEGNICYTKEPSVTSAIINTTMRDRIAVFATSSIKETFNLVLEIAKRVHETPKKYMHAHTIDSIQQHHTAEPPPTINKRESTYVNMLCQVPGVSLKTAKAVAHVFPSLHEMYRQLQEIPDSEKLNKLKHITTQDTKGVARKISSTAAANILQSLFPFDNIRQ